ncbi:hypothetical protein C8R47DRAFT_1064938 [Mycena vitilis]|nr:hypothetical protein C8R47DRAFT_1064938 [Mycena vitilis]
MAPGLSSTSLSPTIAASSTRPSELCPKCRRASLTRPKKCTGHFSKENTGRVYQYCSRHDFSSTSPCKYFRFNDTIEAQFDNGIAGSDDAYTDDSYVYEPSFVPAGDVGVVPDDQWEDWDSDIEFESWFAAMSLSASTSTPNPPSTSASPSASASTSTPSPQRLRCAKTPCQRQRNTVCVQLWCKPCCIQSSIPCSAPLHRQEVHVPRNSFTVGPVGSVPTTPSSVPSTPSTPVRPARAYALPADPSYVHKLAAAAATFNTYNPSQQLDVYKKSQTHRLEVHWWYKDNVAAEAFSVQAPGFPFFHPRDCPSIVEFLTEQSGQPVKLQTYGYWTGSLWMRTDIAVTAKAKTPLYLRSSSVTVCLDGPTPFASGSKRKLSVTAADSPSPQRLRLVQPDIKPLIFSRSSSPASIIDLTSDEETDPPSSTRDVFSASASTPSTAKKPWPLKYFCDMHNGFNVILNSTARTMPLKFEEAFKQPFVNATYYENMAKWKSLSSEVKENGLARGQTPAGEWSYVIKNYKGKGKAIPTQ